MGAVENVNFDSFPEQGDGLNQKVNVCFNYDTSRVMKGVIVREDNEEPFVSIIKLADGRYILTSECQYQYEQK